jgi:hypothetical protein
MGSGISPAEIDMTEHRIFTAAEWDRFQNRDHRVVAVITNPIGVKLFKFDSSARVFWGILANYKSSVIYNIQDLRGVLTSVSKESFLEILSSCYPEDYEFFLWHPEAIDGKWGDYD